MSVYTDIQYLKQCVANLAIEIANAINARSTYIGLYDTKDANYDGKEGFSPVVRSDNTQVENPTNPFGLTLERLVQFQDLYQGNAVIYGGVSLVPGTTNQYYCWASAYIINNVLYASADDFVSDTVTLNAAPTAPDSRFDLFVVQSPEVTGQAEIVVVEGDPDTSPLKPSIDLAIQVELGLKLLGSDETTPPEINTEQVYDENTGEASEWTNSFATTGVNVADTSNPLKNSVHVSFVGTQGITFGQQVQWTNDVPVGFNANTKICFRLQVNGSWSSPSARNQSRIIINLYDGANFASSITLNRTNIINYGYNPNHWNLPFLVTIPITAFTQFREFTQFDSIQFDFDNLADGYLDDIYIQDGIVGPSQPSLLSFLDLIDTPSVYSGMAGKAVIVKTDESGLEFVDIVGGAFEVIDEGNGNGIVKAGRVSANYGNVGLAAFDASHSTSASSVRGATGNYSAAFGRNPRASGLDSFAFGNSAVASGESAVALGYQCVASGDYSFATVYATASGLSSCSLGAGTASTNSRAMSWNNGGLASGPESTAFGLDTVASGTRSTAGGEYTEASGRASWAYGVEANAYSYGEFVVGTNSTSYAPAGVGSYNVLDRAFVVGIGANTGARADGFRVWKNGSIDLPSYGSGTFTGTAAYTLQVDSSGNLIEGAVASGNVTKVGTPVNNELGVWTGDGTIKGDANLTWNGTMLLAQQTGGAVIDLENTTNSDYAYLTTQELTVEDGVTGSIASLFKAGQLFLSDGTNDGTISAPTSGGAGLTYAMPTSSGTLALAEKNGVYRTKVSLSAAQIKSLNSSPIDLIAATGAGTYIRVNQVDLWLNWGTVAFDSNFIQIKTDGATNNQVSFGNSFISSTANTNATGLPNTHIGATTDIYLSNTKVVITSNADSVATGDSTVDVYITYEIITL